MNEFLEQFLIEGRELIDQATGDLLELEQNPQDRERLDSAFRAFHTLKGAAGIVDFNAMGEAVHAVEDALAAVRAGDRPLTAALVTHCLTALDQVTAWMNAIERTGENPAEAEEQAAKISVLFAQAAPEAAAPSAPLVATDRARALIEAQIALCAQGGAGHLHSALRVAANVLRRAGRTEDAGRLDAMAGGALERDAVLRALQAALADDAKPAGPREDGASRAVRVDLARVDALVKLTGELTTTKNAISHVAEMAKAGGDAGVVAAMLAEQSLALDRLVGELQTSVLNVRVLPLRQVFQRFPRLVREMGLELGKPVRLITEGEDTEADKAIVDALFEPLLHVVRNAVDHGIEAPALRAERGKPSVAKVVLRAMRSGENVVVEVEDDGGGVDVARVRALGVSRGLIAPDAAAALSEREVLNLIFAPGFSTASAVTALSGRGVGMDAVRTAIEAMGGAVEIENRPAHGAVVRLLLPFTLMMTRVMVVYAGAQAFGIPFDSIIETVRVPRREISAIGGARAFVYRDRTAAMIDLADSLGAGESERSGEAIVVAARVGGDVLGFEIDRAGAALDVMLTPLDGLLAGTRGVAGVTLLGDGKVLIVLDLPALSA